jgi:indolepyruvate ferredoxin oxidoreductase, beta subunit
MEKNINILITGVGGQGIVAASDILADMALAKGFDVKKSEIHGMSQRGGVVYSFVRFGKKVYSPTPFKNDVDFLVSFEEMETLRWGEYINPKTKVIVNTLRIKPAMMKSDYPDVKTLLKHPHIKYIDAVNEAKKAGNEKTVNSIMLGALCGHLDFTEADFREAISKRLKKYIDENITAFCAGRELA